MPTSAKTNIQVPRTSRVSYVPWGSKCKLFFCWFRCKQTPSSTFPLIAFGLTLCNNQNICTKTMLFLTDLKFLTLLVSVHRSVLSHIQLVTGCNASIARCYQPLSTHTVASNSNTDSSAPWLDFCLPFFTSIVDAKVSLYLHLCWGR